MTDVLDEIIDRLPPSALRLIVEYNDDSSKRNSFFSDLLHDFEQIKVKETNRELKRKITNIKSKTSENRKRLLALKSELEILKNVKKTAVNAESSGAYTEKIKEFEVKLGNLTKGHDNVDLSQLFKDIDNLHIQIEDYKKKISEAKTMYQSYDGFPPDIAEGKKAIAAVKERIRHNKTVVNSLFQA